MLFKGFRNWPDFQKLFDHDLCLRYSCEMVRACDTVVRWHV